MTRSAFALLAIVFVSAPIALVSSACSSDDSPGSSSGIRGFPEDSGNPTEGGGSDASPDSGLCTGLSLGGDTIAELAVEGEVPPALGGAIVPGIYDLSELQVYGVFPDAGTVDGGEPPPVNPLTGKAARATVIVLPNSLRFVEARGTADALGPENARAFEYRADGTAMSATQVCPSAAPAKVIPYSSVGSGLALFPDPNHRELYVRR